MVTKRICDKCGAEGAGKGATLSEGGLSYDLCAFCYSDLLEWFGRNRENQDNVTPHRDSPHEAAGRQHKPGSGHGSPGDTQTSPLQALGMSEAQVKITAVAIIIAVALKVILF